MTSTQPTISCPACVGKGYTREPASPLGIRTHLDNRGRIAKRPCDRCAGTGLVDARMTDWITQGQTLARLRNVCCADLLVAVEVLGAGITQITQAEAGLIDPHDMLARALAAGWDREVRP